jgi:Protein of unknown function (DUF1822)
MLNLEQIKQIDQQTIWLEITPAEIVAAQPQSQHYSNSTGLNNAILNQLCLTKLENWLLASEIDVTPSWDLSDFAALWDVVNGCAIDIGKTRLVLIPTDTLDRDEMRVPQEWVDLPNLLGNYYLAVQVDLEANTMNIWGFISHQLLKQRGEYQPIDRFYSLPSDLLISNLDILWMGLELSLNEISPVAELATLGLESALAIIQDLSLPAAYSPRTKVNWSDWASIINSPNLRAQLHQTRLQKVAIAHTPAPVFSLTDWLRGEIASAIERGWHHDYQSALVLSGEMVERSKLINLQIDLQQHSVVLLVGIIPNADEQMRILVQVYPTSSTGALPPQLQLSYVDTNGAILRTVTARSNDDYIQLPPFTGAVGTDFSIQLQLYSAIVIERLKV